METLVETDTTVEEPVSEETEPQPAASTGTGETSEEPETTETESESVEAQHDESQSDDNQNEEIVYFDGTTKVDTSLWNMILVNPDNYLPDGFTIDKMQVQGNYYLDSRVAPYAIQMIADAKKEGIDLQICSSIRDFDLQTRLFNNKINDLINEGYSKEDARRVAATIVAVPGTSEHHTGLAMDVVTPSYQRLNSGYANTDAAKWLKANAAKYGFILRYPEDKTEITKIIFEPWHYRYVGVEYASFIMSEGICFEEFIELYGETDQ
ncbi:MAG: M15 family metallopeptidase [Clostridia bacterium]|nr:M15 family metallopeptidase [Clostridia bacterium]